MSLLCAHCRKEKTPEEVSFVKSKNRFHSYCKECDAKLSKLRRSNKVVYYILVRLRSRAKQKGIPFDLTEEDIQIPSHCPVLGIKLEMNDSRLQDNSISIDRIIPEKGYVKGNIIVISQRANRIKTDATIDELIKVTNFYKELIGGFKSISV